MWKFLVALALSSGMILDLTRLSEACATVENFQQGDLHFAS
jgi:hypothetical protein